MAGKEGAGTDRHFRDNPRAFQEAKLDAAETAALEKLRAHPALIALKVRQATEFLAGSAIRQRPAL